MFSKPWVRVGAIAGAGILSVLAGFLIFQGTIRHELAIQSAQHNFGKTQLNLLVLGYQSDEGTTDSIVLAHLDVDRQTATLVSIPRDTWVAIPGHGSQKINAAYAFGGTAMSARVVSTLLGGIPIDATVALQPQDAARVIEAIGGLDVNVDENMDYDDNYGGLHIHLRKGEQHLSGRQVTEYIRFRNDAASDFGRMKRQQYVLKLFMNQVSLPQNWVRLPGLLQLARKGVQTSLNDAQLMALFQIYHNVPDDDIRTFTLPGKPGWAGDASVVYVDPQWARLIGDVLFKKVDPPQDEVVVANATGDATFDKTLIGALRGGGWNVRTFVDEPARRVSAVIGDSPAAAMLSHIFAAALRPGARTTLVIGSDLAPYQE
ncbi:MAG TPA: LCP family protein [Candidatus Tyrphobacter sp.]